MIFLLFSLLIAAAHAAKGDVNQVNGAKDLPLTPVLDQSKENSAGACRTLCASNDECIEATFVNGQCSLFHNVVLTRGDINGAVYYKKDRGDFIVDCVGQKLYDDMCRSSVEGAKREKCSEWLSDGTCDHGFTLSETYHQIFLNCEKFDFDGGDCNKKGAVDADKCFSDLSDDVDPNCKVPQDGVIEDCWGQVLTDADCRVAAVGITKCVEWLGDDSCDGGQTVSDTGVVINFACEKFEYDKGDCPKPIEDTLDPTSPPTPNPTDAPSKPPVADPTATPTESPTKSPTDQPTDVPTKEPTDAPTFSPTDSPASDPTASPTDKPTPTPPPIEDDPTESPTTSPTEEGTPTPIEPVTDSPTASTTDAPTLDMTSAPTPPPSSGVYVENGDCIAVESNLDDFSDDTDDKTAAMALDGGYDEITRAWDTSSQIICNPNKKIYQKREAGETIKGNKNKVPATNAVLCYGKEGVLEDKLYAIWNAGEGAEIYGMFGPACNSLTWDQVANKECQNVCTSECKNKAKALYTKPCGQEPTEPPAPEPTAAPTYDCSQHNDEGACKDTPWPPCAWKDNKCIIAPCADQKVSSKCEKYDACDWDKKKKTCSVKPEPTPEPTALPTDQCGGFSASKCDKKDECEFDKGLGLCRLKVVEPTESPTEAPTQTPTQDSCKLETNKKKCKDPCQWKSGKCKRKPPPTPKPTGVDCTTYAAYQQRIADAVKNKKASKSDKDCKKYGGMYEDKECKPWPYDPQTKKTAKFSCKKIKDEQSCGCLKTKCKMKTKKKGRKVKVKCKGKQQFYEKTHGKADPNIG